MPVERLQAASDGLATDAAPDYVGKLQAPVHQNFLSRPGKLVPRGGLENGRTLSGAQDAISHVMPSSGGQATSYGARDDFTSGAGTLNGRAMQNGGTWSSTDDGSGSGDWSVNGSNVQHTSTVVGGRVATAGVTTYTDVVVQCDIRDGGTTSPSLVGVFARGTVNGFTAKVFRSSATAGILQIDVAGAVWTQLTVAWLPATTYTIRAKIDAAGNFAVWLITAGSGFPATPTISGQHVALATGGSAQSGTVGIIAASGGSAGPRVNDNFVAWVPRAADGLVGFWSDTFETALPYKTKTAARSVSGTSITLSDARLAPTTRAVHLGGATYAFGGQTTNANRYLLRYGPENVEPLAYFTSASGPDVETAPKLTGRYGDLIVHLERLFVLGTTLGGQGNTKAIMWSDLGDPGPVTDTTFENWKDDVSGLVNQIQLPGGDDDLPVAFGRVGRSLAIFSERSIWQLLGDTPSTFQLMRRCDNVRVFDPGSVCSVDDGVYALTDRGLVHFDGSQLRPMSGAAQAELVDAVARARADRETANTGFARTEYLPGGYLLVTVGQQAHSGSEVPTIYFAGLLDLTRGGCWTRFSTSIATGEAPTHVARLDGTPTGFDGRSVYGLGSVGLPEAQTFAAEDDDPLTVNALRMPLKWHTRLAYLASPTNAARIRRLFIDYRFDSSLSSGWFVEAVDGLGNVALPEQQLPDTPAGQARTRAVLDVNGEASDLQVQLEWRGTWTSGDDIAAAELHDVHVEFEPAQQRSTAF